MAARRFSVDVSWQNELALDANWLGLSSRPAHFRALRLDGLQISIPPQDKSQRKRKIRIRTNFIIDQITSSNAELDILRTNGKPTLTFLLHQLNMVSFSPKGRRNFMPR